MAARLVDRTPPHPHTGGVARLRSLALLYAVAAALMLVGVVVAFTAEDTHPQGRDVELRSVTPPQLPRGTSVPDEPVIVQVPEIPDSIEVRPAPTIELPAPTPLSIPAPEPQPLLSCDEEVTPVPQPATPWPCSQPEG